MTSFSSKYTFACSEGPNHWCSCSTSVYGLSFNYVLAHCSERF